MAQYGLGGAGLAGFGMGQQDEAIGMLRQAADTEQSRNMQNEQLKQQHQAGNAQLGSMLGGLVAVAAGAGPVGIVLAGIAGAMASDLF
jgi:hypothetical protein